MRTSTIFSALTTVAAVSAAKAYIPYVYNTNVSAHGFPVQARESHFYVGGDATGVCPDYDPNCPSKNTTIISGPTASQYSSNLDGFWMGVLSHQQMFVIDGYGLRLGYTDVNLSVGTGYAQNTPFTVYVDESSNESFLKFNGDDFVACETYNDGILIRFASAGRPPCFDQEGVAFPMKIRLEETTAPAVQYYAN